MKPIKCIRCNKNLKNFESRRIGYGKTCLKRLAEEDKNNQLFLFEKTTKEQYKND